MQETSIGWTDFSANLLKYRNPEGVTVWACVHASEGCRFCYSEALAKRWGRGKAFTAENMKAISPFFDVAEADQILKSKKIAGKKVFVDDMTDLFGEWVADEIIDQHFAIFALRASTTFQILTKRAKRMRDYVAGLSPDGSIEFVAQRLEKAGADLGLTEEAQCQIANALYGVLGDGHNVGWPMRNVHLGVSVEDQRTVDGRIPRLLNTPAAVRWISVEPLIDEVEFGDPPPCLDRPSYFYGYQNFRPNDKHDIDGIVIGGESGHGHREMPLESALRLARYASKAGVAVYFKQDSGPRPGMQGRIPDDVWALKEWPEAKAVSSAA